MPKTVTLGVQQTHLERNRSLSKILGTPLKYAFYIYFKRLNPKPPAQLRLQHSSLFSGPFSTATMMSCPYCPQAWGLEMGHGHHTQRRTELFTYLHCPRSVWGSDIPAAGVEATMKTRVMSEVSWQKATRRWKKWGFCVPLRDGSHIFPCGKEFSSALEILCKLIPRCSGHLSCLDIAVATNSCATSAAWVGGTCE